MEQPTFAVKVTFIALFIVLAGLLIYCYWLGDRLFKLIAEKYPKYYAEIGEPRYFGDPVSASWAGLYLMRLATRGMPKDFPDDEEALRLAKKVRGLSRGVLLLFAVIFLFLTVNIILLRQV